MKQTTNLSVISYLKQNRGGEGYSQPIAKSKGEIIFGLSVPLLTVDSTSGFHCMEMSRS